MMKNMKLYESFKTFPKFKSMALIFLFLTFKVYTQDIPDVTFKSFQKGVGMIFVEGGVFTMGCTREQIDDCHSNEKPTHRTTVSSFYMSKYEITQRQWRIVVGNDPSYFKNCDNCPVEDVSWYDIQDFISKLNNLTGKNYRLPTEIEWEFAARGGTKSKNYKYAGSNSIDKVAEYNSNNHTRTKPVGSKIPNELGLYDMSGNVWEWCQAKKKGDRRSIHCILRGGSWSNEAKYCRVSNRLNVIPSLKNNHYGFRLILDSP